MHESLCVCVSFHGLVGMCVSKRVCMQVNPSFCECVLPPEETRLSELELDLDFACMHMHAVANIRANANSHTYTHRQTRQRDRVIEREREREHTCTH